ncbi:MAG: hypothetical protein KatS3mg100_603 [Candidatus Parcubacteria bacterium]|nr:MAG: hypothetical protein KatS3mg100_603 [Candidatus Parcubacteria bacterium]
MVSSPHPIVSSLLSRRGELRVAATFFLAEGRILTELVPIRKRATVLSGKLITPIALHFCGYAVGSVASDACRVVKVNVKMIK